MDLFKHKVSLLVVVSQRLGLNIMGRSGGSYLLRKHFCPVPSILLQAIISKLRHASQSRQSLSRPAK